MTAKPLPAVPATVTTESRPPSPSFFGLQSPRDELARSLSPLIAVAASQSVDELCQCNHIPSFADYISPFGAMMEGRVSARDWQGVPIAIDNFAVRFRHIDKLNEPSHQAVMALVDERVKSKSTKAPDMQPIRTAADVTDTYLDMGIDEMTPWYADFRKLIMSLRGINEHETFDHPVAVLIAISSADPEPMTVINQLYNPNIPSFTVDRPYVDPNILRYYVLVHDPQRVSQEHAQATFEKMKRTLGLHCFFLPINSQRPAPPTDLLDESEVPSEVPSTSNEAICSIWQESLSDALAIENYLNTYAATPADEANTSQSSLAPSPALSSHTRSSSVSSNASSLAGATQVPGTTLPMSPPELRQPSLDSSTLEQGILGPIVDETLVTAPTVQYGQCLTEGDVDAAKALVRELVVQSLIPFMERNIQLWNEQVASARRGLTGRLFGASRRLFGTTSKTSATHSLQTIPATGPNIAAGVNQLTIYPFGAPEAQMRKLADFAFMIRDYKFAHAIYDTVRRDYATDKAYKYHAGTQEMIGICLLMMNQPLRNKADVNRNFELAVQQYLGRSRSPYHATRTTIMFYELLKAHRMWKDVPTALVRMTGEDSDLRSALFLEQAAHCFLRAPRPMVRKYGFHVVMAAHRYAKANQRQHAFRCYQMASYIFENHEWTIAKSHIQFALGRQAFHLGRLEEATVFFANVLPDAKQTPQQQAAHVREFLFIYSQYTSQAGIDPLKESLPNLALPIISDKDIRITLSNAQSDTDHQEEWETMERQMLEENIATGVIYGSRKALALQQQDDQRVVCAIGEPASVHVQVYNPLQVAIKLSHVTLGCQHRPSMKISTEKRDLEAEAYEPMVEGKPLDEGNMFDFGEYELEKIPEVTLEPLEKRTLNIAIIPRREGSLFVKGLHYTFNDLVHTFRPFHKKGKRLNTTQQQRMTVTYAPDHSLDILVTSPMPLLDLAFHNVPETILSGEVVQAVLEINNKGNKGLTALRLKTSHPSFICISNPEDMDKPVYGGSDAVDTVEDCTIENRVFDPSVISIPLPTKDDEKSSCKNGVVGPGNTTLAPLWIRGDRIGKHVLKFLFSYQSEEDNTAIVHRTLRYTVQIQVHPSLKINAFTRPSAASGGEYILGVEIENLQTAASFQLTQLSAFSSMWTLVPLSIQLDSRDDVVSKTNIPPRQTSFAYYKICNLKKNNKDANHLYSSKLVFSGPCIPFDTVPLKTFALSSRTQWLQNNVLTQYPNQSNEEQEPAPSLYKPGDVDLTIYWDMPSMKRHGHHYIIGISLANTSKVSDIP